MGVRRGRSILIALAICASGTGSAPATPAACADPCVVTAHEFAGYIPAVVEISSGNRVQWTSIDTAHPTVPAPGQPPCFISGAALGHDPAPVKLRITSNGLTATVSGVTKPCTGAVAVADSYVQPYACLLHTWMRGVLVVTP